MSEPTIEDMVAWLDHIKNAYYYGSESLNATAIRAILERHRDSIPTELIQCFKCHKIMPDVCTFYCGDCDPATTTQLEAIRAFVERVEKRLPDYNTGKGADSWLKAYRLAVMDELAAMEKETQ